MKRLVGPTFAVLSIVALFGTTPVGARAGAADTPPTVTAGNDGYALEYCVTADSTRSDCPPDQTDSNFASADQTFGRNTLLVSPDFGSATAKTHIHAAATSYPDDITQIHAEGDIAGFAQANQDVPPFTTTPKSRASTSYDFQFQSSDGHTAFPYSIGVDFSGTNQDHDTCVVLQVEFQGLTGTGHSFDRIMTRNVGGGCANRGSGSLPTEGNLLAGDISFGVGGRVDAEKKGKVTFSGHLSVDVGLGAGVGCSAPGPSTAPIGGVTGTQQCTQTPIGQLVYQSGGPSDVFVMDAGGFDPAQPLNLSVTPNKNERTPAWSPDGKHVAFERGGQIFTMTAGGSDLTQLTTDGLNEEPAWSPDGSQIAFTSNRDGNFELYVMDQDGKSQTRLTHNPATDSESDWSPDGNTIAFDSDRHGNPDIFSMSASPGAAATRLTADPASDFFPSFAPDGTIVFQTDRDGNEEIYSMQGDGENPKDLTNDPGQDGEPTVSPDGQFVAFSSQRGGSDDLWFVPIAGGDATQLTHHAGATFPDWGISACTLYGTGGNDTITGDGHVCGGPGDDHLTAGGASDTLDGGPGIDTIKGNGGSDTIFGGDGNDDIQGGEDGDSIDAGPGDDTISGGGGQDFIFGEDGNDDIDGDLLTTHSGNDIIHGGEGNDIIDGGPGHDSLHGGPGNDTIDDGPDGDNPFTPNGLGGVFGGPGDDIITACNGAKDTIDGGADHDTATIDKTKDVVTTVEVTHFC